MLTCENAVGRAYARWDEPDEETIAAAVAELREIADGRANLLAEVAGILWGARIVPLAVTWALRRLARIR